MILKLEAGKLKTEIELPGSKSHANRYLILAARRGLGTRVHALPVSDDVTLLLEGLEKIGLQIEGSDPVIFKNSFPACEADEGLLSIDVGEGGTTARFLLALLCRGKRQYLLQTRGRLKERPWEELIQALTDAGAKIEWRGTNLLVQGPVDLKKLPRKISASRSTQFASALQLAYAADGLIFEPYDLTSSTPYWLITCQAIKDIHGGVLTVPADWSSASYPMALACLQNDSILLRALRPDDQADRALFDFLLSRGAAQVTSQGIIVSALEDRSALAMNVTQCPDLAPTLAFLASHLEGESILSGLSVLRHKESDRLQAICDLLAQCGVSHHYDENLDELRIRGGVQAKRWDLKVPADHRLVMVGSLFLKLHQGGTISHPEAVRKSFPDFFKIFE